MKICPNCKSSILLPYRQFNYFLLNYFKCAICGYTERIETNNIDIENDEEPAKTTIECVNNVKIFKPYNN